MEYNRNDIRNIAFEKINDRFSKGTYLGVNVTMDMTTGYINGNHLVSQVKTKTGKPKRFDHWKENKEAREMIEYLMPPGSPGPYDLLIEIADVPNELKGTYVHPHLISHLAQWASPIFAHKVSIILNDKAISDALLEKDRLLIEKDKLLIEKDGLIVEKDDKIDNLSKTISDLRNDIQNLTKSILVQTDTINNQTETIEGLTDQNNTIIEKLDDIREFVVPEDKIKERNEVTAIYSKCDSKSYYSIRCQKRNFKGQERIAINMGYKTQIYYKDDPNSVNMLNRVKTLLKSQYSKQAHVRYNNINLITMTESEFTKIILDCENEKRIL